MDTPIYDQTYLDHHGHVTDDDLDAALDAWTTQPDTQETR